MHSLAFFKKEKVNTSSKTNLEIEKDFSLEKKNKDKQETNPIKGKIIN